MEERSRIYRCLHSAAVKKELFCTSSTDKDISAIFNFPRVLEKNQQKKFNRTHSHRNYVNCTRL